jgi:putative flippase GtrA
MEVPVRWDNPAGHTVTVGAYLATLIELFRILARVWTGAYQPEGARKTGGQLVRFGIAGIVNTGVDIAVFNALFFIFGGGVPLTFYKAASFSAAVVNSFYWNRYFVFDAATRRDYDAPLRFAKFLMISVGGLAINTLAFQTSHAALASFPLESAIAMNAAVILATCASLVWNFIGYKYVVFARM